MTIATTVTTVDVPVTPLAIIGAGPIGAVAALALSARGVPVRMFEARAPGTGKVDQRAIAVSWGSRLALEPLGIWSRLARVDPIERVSVSERGAFGSIEFSASDLGVPALGYVVDYGDLARACADALADAGIAVAYGTALVALDAKRAPMRLTLAAETGATYTLDAQCVVLADGAEASGADAALRRHERVYRQVALIGEVACTRFRRAQAFERFAGSGPLALLPRRDHYACVWVLESEPARRLLDAGAPAQARALEAAAGPGFGAMQWLAAPRELPLALRWRTSDDEARVIPIGNAAQLLHPVAGQGFNLGVRDALALAAEWPAARRGSDIFDVRDDATVRDDLDRGVARTALDQALRRFRRARRVDRALTIALTDGMARITAIDNPAAAVLRGVGLCVLDVVPNVRRRVLQTLVFGAP
ncbi:MAG: FAD-dependent monooxygenase [Proteobacteria bacterium]|nr:FAD-dependent monooxygenase [Burkholderiales bacterium]